VIILMRLTATVIRYLCDILLALYDVVVSIPLWLEHQINRRRALLEKPVLAEEPL
jgi:hypothetical protein